MSVRISAQGSSLDGADYADPYAAFTDIEEEIVQLAWTGTYTITVTSDD